MEISDFVCSKCGECCRHLAGIAEAEGFHRDGVCVYLKGDLCSIYEKRPDMCRKEKVYELYKDAFSKEDFVKLITKFCRKFQSMRRGILRDAT